MAGVEAEPEPRMAVERVEEDRELVDRAARIVHGTVRSVDPGRDADGIPATWITLDVDELACQGTGAFVFASVLEHYFRRHAAINAFTRLTLRSPQRGELHTWAPRIGSAELV